MSDVDPIGPGTGKKKGSIWKYLGIGCLVVILLLVILAVVLYMQYEKLAKFGIGKMTEQVIQSLPTDVDRGEARKVTEKATENLLSDDQEKKRQTLGYFMEYQNLFKEALQDKNLDQDEAMELYGLLRQMAGMPEPEPEPEPETEQWESSQEGETGISE